MTTRKEAPYYVWRRNDGLVDATRYNPATHPQRNGTTFKVLLVTEDWSKAYDLIESETSEIDD